MNPSTDTVDLTHFDVRSIPCRVKHGQIFQRWASLAVGAHFVLINDHDPVPLYYQFAGQFPGAFNWEYLVAGPDEFQVKITRLAETPAPAITPPPPPNRIPLTPASSDEIDARGLEPPEPMVLILNAVENLTPGRVLRARTDRRPIHLLPELAARGIQYETTEGCDGSWVTTLQRT
jgi:uncharacterized protein (DUF2249 family)